MTESTSMPVVRVSAKAAARVESGHPWIFSSDVVDRGAAQAGDAVRVVDGRGRSLGTAHYSASSQITLRLLSRKVEAISREFLAARLAAAEAHRKQVVADAEAYRLVHAEGDQLPGLIIDRYGSYFAVQLLDQGMDRLAPEIVSLLNEQFAPAGIVLRNDVPIRAKEELPLSVTVASGTVPPAVSVKMNGLLWGADLVHGQKTGIFLDQRENYQAVARYGKGGRALDCFTATGGFAMHLAKHAESVQAVDSSEPALQIARANAGANHLQNIEWRRANVLELLPQLVNAHRSYDVVVVDPPAFTKSRGGVAGALRGYKEINLRALKLLAKNGVLVSCSCSHHVGEADLLEVVAAAALDAGKSLRVLERRTQSQDHPILLTVPETHYLKCLVLQVL